jgi:hypothetical protein
MSTHGEAADGGCVSLTDFKAFEKLNEETLKESNEFLDKVLGDKRAEFLAALLQLEEFALLNDVDITTTDAREKLDRLIASSEKFNELIAACDHILKRAMVSHGIAAPKQPDEAPRAVSERAQQRIKRRIGVN